MWRKLDAGSDAVPYVMAILCSMVLILAIYFVLTRYYLFSTCFKKRQKKINTSAFEEVFPDRDDSLEMGVFAIDAVYSEKKHEKERIYNMDGVVIIDV